MIENKRKFLRASTMYAIAKHNHYLNIFSFLSLNNVEPLNTMLAFLRNKILDTGKSDI